MYPLRKITTDSTQEDIEKAINFLDINTGSIKIPGLEGLLLAMDKATEIVKSKLNAQTRLINIYNSTLSKLIDDLYRMKPTYSYSEIEKQYKEVNLYVTAEQLKSLYTLYIRDV